MQDSYLMSRKELYLQTLLESDQEKLTELVLATEQVIALDTPRSEPLASKDCSAPV